MLNSQQVNDFQRQGYLVLNNFFTNQQVSRLREAALGIVDDFDIDEHRTVFKTTDRDADRDDYFFDSAEAIHCFLEEDAVDASGQLTQPKELAINKIGHAIHDLEPTFSNFCQLPQIGEVLREVGYQAPLLWQSMYIFKQPQIGGEVRWHQDASYLISEPATVSGLWVAIEDATRDNGCMWMQPGQHQSPLREIYEVDWEARHGQLRILDETPWESATTPVALEVAAGSAVLFKDHMPHYSSKNLSDQSRHAFTIHIAEQGALWSKKNWLQRPRLGAFEL
nr:uncharacterized protein LOC133597180 [Nerophis lumbriciformis]XP_061806081.1 uncharacterized protein LOC133597236 [Nerophis lumbriciformis]